MRNSACALCVALVTIIGLGRAENVRDEALRLIADDVKSGGKTLPKGPNAVLTQPKELKTVEKEDPEVLVLPKMEVTAPKLTPFEKKLEELDKAQAWEEQGTKLSWLEALLNGNGFANARVQAAKDRVEIMRWERLLFVALLEAKTAEERKQIREEIRTLKEMRRYRERGP